MTNARTTQVVTEALQGGVPGLRSTQVTLGVLLSPVPRLRSTQVMVEVLRRPSPKLRTPQIVVESITPASAPLVPPVLTHARVTHAVVEGLAPTNSTTTRALVTHGIVESLAAARVLVNDRDKLLQATQPRIVTVAGGASAILLVASAAVISNGAPATVTFTVQRLNVNGTAQFTTQHGTVLSVSGDTATMNATDLSVDSELVTVAVVDNGATFTAFATVGRVNSGASGTSARIAYSVTSLATLASVPATIQTSGNGTLPPNASWGADTVWSAQPTGALQAGQKLYRSDATYDPATNLTTWSAPYLANLKVGQLSALSVDAGSITAGDFYGTTMHGGPGYPTNAYAWPATAGAGGGFLLSENGLLMGNKLAGQFVQILATGEFEMPGLAYVNGNLTFSGDLSAGRISVGTGSQATMFFDQLQSGVSLNSSATGTLAYTGTAGAAVLTANTLLFKNNDLGWPIERRLRTGAVFFTITASAVVDDELSIWYRVNGGAWQWLNGVKDPAAGDGTCATGWGMTLTIAANDTVQIGVSCTDANLQSFDMAKLYLNNAQVTVTARNF